jgi:hypothetical protein
MEPPTQINPYAPGAAADAAQTKPRPPRWLAVLVSAITSSLVGSGLFLLRRSRRDWIWPAVGLVLLASYALSGALAPALLTPVMAAMVLFWAAGVIVTLRAPAGDFVGWSRTLLLTAGIVVAQLAVAHSVRAFAVESFQIPSMAMLPTLMVGDRIFVAKGGVRARGDVIVFKYPLGPETDYVKRVIGLPGETVTITTIRC